MHRPEIEASGWRQTSVAKVADAVDQRLGQRQADPHVAKISKTRFIRSMGAQRGPDHEALAMARRIASAARW
jgi:hypothetical protein